MLLLTLSNVTIGPGCQRQDVVLPAGRTRRRGGRICLQDFGAWTEQERGGPSSLLHEHTKHMVGRKTVFRAHSQQLTRGTLSTTTGRQNTGPKNKVTQAFRKFLERDGDTCQDDKYKLRSWIPVGRNLFPWTVGPSKNKYIVNEVF